MLYTTNMVAKQSKRENANYIQTGFRLTEGKHIELKIIAAKEGKSLNLLLEEIVDKFIDGYRKKSVDSAFT